MAATVVVCTLLALIAGDAETKTIEQDSIRATIDVPQHELVTITESPGFLFYSIMPGYEPPDDEPFVTIPAEISIRLVKGNLEEVVANQRKTYIKGDRKIIQELKRQGQLIWLVDEGPQSRELRGKRGFQFIGGEGVVLIIDATAHSQRNMPPRQRKLIADLLLRGLKSVKLNDTAISTAELQKHVQLR